ncbi:MAG: NAD-dependent epimerase/dehydratase [Candidatus Angelobacter sp.]|nr:NAD-dependent epimerase/dehydratase [Candidatus Angelobacter sp.]
MRKLDTRSVLILGGAGFIGSNLAHSLLSYTDAKVHIFDNLSRAGVHHNLEWLRKTAGNAGRLQVTVGDVRDARQVEKAVAHASEIYHFAAQVAVTTSVADPRLDFETNLAGTFNVLDAARRSGNQPFILFTSTNKVYGELGLGQAVTSGKRYVLPRHYGVSESQPLDFHSPYGCSKGAADQYVRDFGRIYGIPSVVFRMSCVAGPRQFGTEDQGWVAHFVYSALQEEPVVIYGDGRQVRDVLCVDDLVRAFEAARQNIEITRTEVYNVGGGPQNSASLLELMDEIASLTGHPMECVMNERRVGDQLVYITDNAKIQRDTGWKPETSLKKILRHLQEFWQENQGMLSKRRRAAAPVLPAFALATELSGRAG